MYGYSQYIPLTQEEITQRVSEKDVFSIVIKDSIIVGGQKYLAPYRNDKEPDCYFEEYNGKLYFVDFADIDPKPKCCIRFIMRCFGINYSEALLKVNNYFQLGLSCSFSTVKKAILIPDVKTTVKTIKDVWYLTRDFEPRDKIFWSSYGITKQNLTDDIVHATSLYQSTSRKNQPFTVRIFDLGYVYADFDEGRVKIYRPNSISSKWFTNCNQNDVGSIKHLPPKGKVLVITKAYKCCRVLRNIELNSVWFQNEGVIPDITILLELCERFEQIVVWYDNDSTGLANGKILVDYINSLVPGKARLVFLAPKLLQVKIKDPSDLRRQRGEQELINFTKQQKIIV